MTASLAEVPTSSIRQKVMRLDLFHLSERGTTWQREIFGGTTTFMTMGYIIFWPVPWPPSVWVYWPTIPSL